MPRGWLTAPELTATDKYEVRTGLQRISEQFEQQPIYTLRFGEAVDSNATIVEQIIARVLGLEQVTAATGVETDQMDNASARTGRS